MSLRCLSHIRLGKSHKNRLERGEPQKKGGPVLIKLSALWRLPALAILHKLAVASDALTTKPWPPLPSLSLQKDTD